MKVSDCVYVLPFFSLYLCIFQLKLPYLLAFQICKDKVEAEVWIGGLKALISSGRGGRSKIDGWSDGGLYLDVNMADLNFSSFLFFHSLLSFVFR